MNFNHFFHNLTAPIGDFEEKIDNIIPGGTPIWRLRQKLAENLHHESGISPAQAVLIGASIGTGATAYGAAGAGGGTLAEGGGATLAGEGAAGAGAGAGASTVAGEGGYTMVPNYTPSAEASGPGAFDADGMPSYQSPAASPTGKPNFQMPGQQQQRSGRRHSVYDISPMAAPAGNLSDANGNPLPPDRLALLTALMQRQQEPGVS